MLYKQLNRVNELDTEINTLHERLANLYSERSRLLMGKEQTTAPKEVHTPITKFDTRATYDQLNAVWANHGLKLPAYKSTVKKIQKAIAIVERLQAENSNLDGKISIVAVPPHKQLFGLLDTPDKLPFEFEFSELSVRDAAAKTKSWSFVVITDPEFSLPIHSLPSLLDEETFRYKSYDCRALGVREFIAAELQGIQTVAEGAWTLLLKDSTSDDYVPCVTFRDDHIVFDIDDTSCLLGNNYLQPAILAA